MRSTSEYGIQFYSTEEVEWYILGNEDVVDDSIETCKENPVTDKEYFIYGKEQNDLVFRPEYCKTALQISSEDMGFTPCATFFLAPFLRGLGDRKTAPLI